MKKYWKEIILLFFLKAVCLIGLWLLFFQSPVILSDKQAGDHILKVAKY